MGISVGLVGLGSFGRAFADLFMAHPAVDRIALCDREPERVEAFAKKESWQAKFDERDAYVSLDDICTSDLDALVIITQPWLHAPQCLQAMEAGKHVYSAVPIMCVPDGDEILDWCDKLVETCKRTGLYYMLGETTYYRPEAMYCRRRAAQGAFGAYVYSEGEYFHDVAHGLHEVQRRRLASKAGQEWLVQREDYSRRGVRGGPMHYPTHSTGGPMCVMGAHATRVCAWGWQNRTGEEWYSEADHYFSNETALFEMSNGSTMRICEYREIGLPGWETFRVYGTEGSYAHEAWLDKGGRTALTVEEMRDPLPDEVVGAWQEADKASDFYGGHGGSHAYLVHEFVDAVANDRMPVTNIWEAVRYMAAGVTAHKSALRDGEVLDVPDWGDAPG